jgi:hypothetical protein
MKASMHVDAEVADAASRAALFAYTLSDFMKRLKMKEISLEMEWLDEDTLKLTRDVWRLLWPSLKPGMNDDTAWRAWERWKGRIERLRLGRKAGHNTFWFDFNVSSVSRSQLRRQQQHDSESPRESAPFSRTRSRLRLCVKPL